jgi:hypothetical protein
MITRAVRTAYKKMQDRNWDTIYYLVDLHETVFHSDYDNVALNIYPEAKKALQYLCMLPETKIILWSSVYEQDKETYINELKTYGIVVDAFNVNPFEGNTKMGCFSEKPYFSVVIDDKAGFIPSEWTDIMDVVKEIKYKKDLQ